MGAYDAGIERLAAAARAALVREIDAEGVWSGDPVWREAFAAVPRHSTAIARVLDWPAFPEEESVSAFPELKWLEAYRERVNADPERAVIGSWFIWCASLRTSEAIPEAMPSSSSRLASGTDSNAAVLMTLP